MRPPNADVKITVGSDDGENRLCQCDTGIQQNGTPYATNFHLTRFIGVRTYPILVCAACRSGKIDVMVLFTGDGLDRAAVGGVTAAQMLTLIANELPKSTEAVTNSGVDLQFNLVHAGRVSCWLLRQERTVYEKQKFPLCKRGERCRF